MTDDFAELADSMLESMRAYCDERETQARKQVCAGCEELRESNDQLRRMFEGLQALYLELEQRVATIPAGPAGEKGDKGDQGERGLAGQDGRDGRDGLDGAPGRDALQLEPVGEIDSTRRYQRGTYASYNGGMVRAMRTTDALEGKDLESAGWQITHNGIADLNEHAITTTDGKSVRIRWAFQGDFDPAKEYQRGDMVRFRGSLWHCNALTSEMPGGKDELWTLAVKGVRTDPQAHYIGVVPKRKV